MGTLDKEIRAYYLQLDRSLFMEEYQDQAQVDSAFPIGHGQTISQPSLVLSMTLQLELTRDCRVLEIGTGSGYQTALLAAFARQVYSVERIEPLYEKARERLSHMGFNNIVFHLGDGSQGWPEHAPYDRIMVTAAVSQVPQPLLDQLRPGGKMVIPVGPPQGQELQLISKDEKDNVDTSLITYVRFVRFVGPYQ